MAFRAGGRGDLSGKSLLWRYSRSVPQLPTTLVYRGRLHMINDGGILTTFDAATGAVKKQARLRGAVDHLTGHIKTAKAKKRAAAAAPRGKKR